VCRLLLTLSALLIGFSLTLVSRRLPWT
jgi:hypothetical protein